MLDNSVINLRTYSSECCTHAHEYYQWVFPLQGNLELQIGHKEGIVNSEQAALIPPNEKHCFASTGENSFIVLDIKSKKSWMNHLRIPPFYSLPSSIKEFLPFAKNYMVTKASDLHSQIIVAEFFEKLLMQEFLNTTDPIIVRARNWIDSYFTAPINLKALAKICFLSSSQLQRRFKRIIGQSIGEYWRMKRLQQAARLLYNSGLPIEAIAYAVGYDNVAAFSRSFTQQYQMSPSQRRKMHFSAKNMHLIDNTFQNNGC